MITITANTIHVYESASKLIDDNTTASEWSALRSRFAFDEEWDNFCNLEDPYENYVYLLLDYERVVMIFDSEPMREWNTLQEFIDETVEEVRRDYFEQTGGDDYGNNPPLSSCPRVEQNVIECTDPETGAFDWELYQYFCDVAESAGCEE